MAAAEANSTVKVKFTGKLEDGTVFASTEKERPLEFTLGKNQVLPGFEKAVFGMNQGESKEVTVPPEEAFGQKANNLVGILKRSQIPENVQVNVGVVLQLNTPEGQQMNARIVKIEDENVTIDANHPLAGRSLNFAIELLEINTSA